MQRNWYCIYLHSILAQIIAKSNTMISANIAKTEGGSTNCGSPDPSAVEVVKSAGKSALPSGHRSGLPHGMPVAVGP